MQQHKTFRVSFSSIIIICYYYSTNKRTVVYFQLLIVSRFVSDYVYSVCLSNPRKDFFFFRLRCHENSQFIKYSHFKCKLEGRTSQHPFRLCFEIFGWFSTRARHVVSGVRRISILKDMNMQRSHCFPHEFLYSPFRVGFDSPHQLTASLGLVPPRTQSIHVRHSNR